MSPGLIPFPFLSVYPPPPLPSPPPQQQVFLKTFRSVQDRPHACDPVAHEKMVQKEIEVLLQADEHRIPDHPSLVNQSRVCYGTVEVPSTGHKGEMFFIVSPDLCQGGGWFL